MLAFQVKSRARGWTPKRTSNGLPGRLRKAVKNTPSVNAYDIRGRVPYKKHMVARVSALYSTVLLLLVSGSSLRAEDLPLFRDDAILKAVLTAPIAQAYAQKDMDCL